MRTKISIVNDDGQPFMGPGLLKLLKRIEQHKSINKAAKDMRLSYVKALNMLNRLENDLGDTVLIRTRGGKTRGGTELTSFGKRYIREYDKLEKQIRRKADKEFENFTKRLPVIS
ncbi:MAG: LysR family transcriptional regulator [Proteobacteria bacterium]|nr:LysR family transcriptional regulator [Pseudomonadota bacterium]